MAKTSSLDEGYRTFLRRALERRIRRNPRYTLSAFARDLELAPTRLSAVLNAKQGLSRVSAAKIARRLELSDDEASRFCDLVEAEDGRNATVRELAKSRLRAASGGALPAKRALAPDIFRLVADWSHFALLELMRQGDFRVTPPNVAKRLGLTPSEAKGVLARLVRLGLVRPDVARGHVAVEESHASPDGVPSAAIRSSHRQLLRKALRSLEEDDIAKRDFSSVMLTLRASQMESARALIREFRRQFSSRLAEARGDKGRVYNLAIQLYPIDKESP